MELSCNLRGQKSLILGIKSFVLRFAETFVTVTQNGLNNNHEEISHITISVIPLSSFSKSVLFSSVCVLLLDTLNAKYS